MGVKETLEQVRSQFSEEESSKYGALIKQAINEVIDLGSDLSAANSESKSRKLEIRETLKPRIDELETELAEWKKKADNSAVVKERDTYKSKYTNLLAQQKSRFVSDLKSVMENEKFEKVKGRFVLPRNGEGELNFDEIEHDDLEKNISALNDLKEIDYFEDAKPSNVDGRKGTKPPTRDEEYIQAINSAKSHREIEAIQKKYGKLE